MTDTYRPQDSGRFPIQFRDESNPPEATQPKHAPAKSPLARWLVVILGLLLWVCAGIAIRDVLILGDSIGGEPWLPHAFSFLSELDANSFNLPLAIGAGVVGLILLLWAIKPRVKQYRALSLGADETDQRGVLWLRPVDVARIATSAAQKVQGVVRAHSVATKKKLVVRVVPAVRDDEYLVSAVKDAVQAQLPAAFTPKHVIVKITRNQEVEQ